MKTTEQIWPNPISSFDALGFSVKWDLSERDSNIASAILSVFKNKFAQFASKKIVFLTLSSASLPSIYYFPKEYNPEL